MGWINHNTGPMNSRDWKDPHDPKHWRRWIEKDGKLIPLSWEDYCKILETDKKTGRSPHRSIRTGRE